MAGRQRPSFLKRQKEQARMARAAEKRDAQRARKQGRLAGRDEDGGTIGAEATDMVSEESDTVTEESSESPIPE